MKCFFSSPVIHGYKLIGIVTEKMHDNWLCVTKISYALPFIEEVLKLSGNSLGIDIP